MRKRWAWLWAALLVVSTVGVTAVVARSDDEEPASEPPETSYAHESEPTEKDSGYDMPKESTSDDSAYEAPSEPEVRDREEKEPEESYEAPNREYERESTD